MILLELSEVLDLHDRLLAQSGGMAGIRDLGCCNRRSHNHS
jgi:hypothetical protein